MTIMISMTLVTMILMTTTINNNYDIGDQDFDAHQDIGDHADATDFNVDGFAF